MRGGKLWREFFRMICSPWENNSEKLAFKGSLVTCGMVITPGIGVKFLRYIVISITASQSLATSK